MADPKNIYISEYTYELPVNRIAQHPLKKRDESKLLVYQSGSISNTLFNRIPGIIPGDSLLIFNDTKVIKARLLFPAAAGKTVEIFCLEPSAGNMELHGALSVTGSAKWNCFVGNLKAWKGGKLSLQFSGGTLNAEISERKADSFVINFNWQPEELTFAEVLEKAGNIPLPPYMKRSPESEDSERYQTIYANEEGSVAAPTAGLHFTESVLNELKQRSIKTSDVTLHVGAGTFKPVKSETISGHEMHSEIFTVSKSTIESVLQQSGKNIIAVGTTSLRTMESVYWYGVRLIKGKDAAGGIYIEQWEPYDDPSFIPTELSLNAVLNEMKRSNSESITGRTGIIIVPGYEFKVFSGLITNFHQPGSTLLLLVAAFIGSDWKMVYDYALLNDFRFLSYGDSSILFK